MVRLVGFEPTYGFRRHKILSFAGIPVPITDAFLYLRVVRVVGIEPTEPCPLTTRGMPIPVTHAYSLLVGADGRLRTDRAPSFELGRYTNSHHIRIVDLRSTTFIKLAAGAGFEPACRIAATHLLSKQLSLIHI